jgi:4-hydroxybenzoate polyprenyltransferase
MGRALLILGWLATAGLLVTGIVGFQVEPVGGLGLHLLVALFSSLLILFSHTWIMFYLIGTGKAVKTAVAEHELDAEYAARTIEFKNRSYPWLMLAMGVVMTTFIIGGGVATRVIPSWIHAVLFGIALLVQIRSLILEGEVLLANDRLMKEVDQAITTG